jgi:hypothetical protein
VFRLSLTKPQPAGGTCHGPGQLQLLGPWAINVSIPSTESGAISNHQPIGGSDPNHDLDDLGSGAHPGRVFVCVLLLQDLLQSCSRGGRGRVEDRCYERRRAEACVDESAHHALCLLCAVPVCGCVFYCVIYFIYYIIELCRMCVEL